MKRGLSTMWMVLGVAGVAGVAGVSSGQVRSSAKSRPQGLTLSAVETLARKFLAENEVVHATSDDPDLPGTPLASSLKKCQIGPQRALSHKSFAKFFGSKKFFAASSCGNNRYAVISVDRARQVKLVALNPHVRTTAPAWDHDVDDGIVIRSTRDFQEFVAAWIYLKTLVDVPVPAIRVSEERGKGEWANTYYLTGTWDEGPSAKRRPKTFEVTMSSVDKLTYSIASHSLSL